MLPRRRVVVVGATVLVGALVLLYGSTGGGGGAARREGRRHPNQEEYTDRRGIRVIVGHYKGDDGPGPNLTQHELDGNHFLPEGGAGEGGRPVILPNHQTIQAKRLFHINQFNIMVSDKISLDRRLEDARSPDCRLLHYDVTSLPTTSIVVVFHNEAWSTLLRTLHSALNTAPSGLIAEFILVDDASSRPFLGAPLERELEGLAVPARVVRSSSRVGLIQARLLGARVATGQVLTFLDAHCECSPGWLEPLLHRVGQDRTAVVCPVIDIINDDTFQYTKSFSLHWGAFNWDLHFRWYTLGPSEIDVRRGNMTSPYRTPVMAGGLFSIDRDYFWESGSYDEGMDIWGAENLEMSFRVWQCGGRVEIAPCSRVGHVFRKASPYSFPREGGVGAVLHSNLARLALTWMDEYKGFFYRVNGHARAAAEGQDVSKRLQLREELKCKSFDWYLAHVWPEHFLPRPGQFFGRLASRLPGRRCLQKPWRRPGAQSSAVPTGPAGFEECTKDFVTSQLFAMSEEGAVMGDESVCLDCPQWEERDAGVRFAACSGMERQRWQVKGGQLLHSISGLCLTVPGGATSDSLTLQHCSGDTGQLWRLEEQQWR